MNGVHKVQVFDPALSSQEDENLPARMEVWLYPSAYDLTAPSYEEETHDWLVYHYGRLMKIEPFDLHDDWEVADFNMSGVPREPVVPITVTLGKAFEDFYVRYSEARSLLNQLNTPHEVASSGGSWMLIPNESWARESKIAYRLQHTRHTCVRCFREMMADNPKLTYERIPTGAPVEVAPRRFIDLCPRHETVRKQESYERRKRVDA